MKQPTMKKTRIESFFERVNEIVGNTKTTVTLNDKLDETNIFEENNHGPNSFITIASDTHDKITPNMKATNYHKLSHLLYSGQTDDAKSGVNSNKLWRDLEDGRIETLFTRQYPGAGSYFETETIDEIMHMNPMDANNFIPLYMRRKFLSKPYHQAYEEAFDEKHTKEVSAKAKNLMDEYLTITNTARQHQILDELSSMLKISHQPWRIMQARNYRATNSDVKRQAQELKDEIESEKKQEAEGESEGESDGKSDSEEDSESEDEDDNKEQNKNIGGHSKSKSHGMNASHDFVKNEKRETYDLKSVDIKEAIEIMKNQRDELKEEQKIEAEKDTEIALEVQKFEDAEKIRMSVERMLRDYRAGNVPEMDFKLRSGNIDIKRAMHPRERLDIFCKTTVPYEGLDFNLQIYVDTSGSMMTGGYNKKIRADIALDIANGVSSACEKYNCPTEVIQFESESKVIYPFNKKGNTKFSPVRVGGLGGGTTLRYALDMGLENLRKMMKLNGKPGVIVIISDGFWECDCYYREHIKESNPYKSCTKMTEVERKDKITIAPIIFCETREQSLRHGLKDSRWVKDDLSDLNVEIKILLDKVEQRVLGLRQ